ncbi:hypothetical protein GCM10008924_24600 [Gracilibacillus halotolerans]
MDDFKGKTADSVKGFYRAQIDVVNSWIDFIDLQEAFFKGIKGMADDEDLGGKTLVHLPFLESDLKNSESRARQMVDSQEQALEDIFSGISDIVSLEPNSTKRFDKHIDEATKKRKETKEKVENFDQTLLEFYEQSKYHENVIAGLISELYKASSQGGEVNPLYFNEEAYKKSDVHTAREEAKEITAKYISWQDELERARELENRSFGEKTWDTICTFTGEVTGYYDMKRASTGVDPVTGQVLTDGQRATSAALAAAGFIPFVGWAGRAAKGGHAIYKTSKTFSAADNVLNAYKTTEAFDILKTSERGLYGLASANGFSEFITGRDIFGNPISEEEQQAGFERALLLLPFKGKTANPVLGVRDDARGTSKGAGKYQVGAYKDIKGVEGLDAHHAGQKAAMKKLVDNYDLNTAPAINVPKVGHTIKGPNGIVSRSTKGIDNPRQLLARDIRELRRVYDDIPNSALKELIELNKKMYPEMRK